MGMLLIGIIIEFITSIGFVAFGYTLGSYFPNKSELENVKNKGEIIDELIRVLQRMKES